MHGYGKKILLVKYGEIALRKGNRILFEKQLRDTLRYLINMGNILVTREQGRLLIEDIRGDLNEQALLPLIQYIPGITAFCPGIKISANDIDTINAASLAFLRGNSPMVGLSFKIETKRGDKSYPLTSQEISAAVGEYILKSHPGLIVNLRHPEITLCIELRRETYIYAQSIPGVGGLPYGSSGKGILLLSGGIDSPVAGYLTALRGVEIEAVYFHSPPHTSERVVDKVTDISRLLARYTNKAGIKLWVAPFTDLQMYLYKRVKSEKLTIFLKRAMLNIASLLAAREQAHCLITGDSIGQVASQTIHALESVRSAAAFPVLRPLATMDKQQIINIAQTIGTYDISIRPYEDCCTLFVAKHPECRPQVSAIESIASRLMELPGLTEDALARAEALMVTRDG
jgi:thiamine biosynthesis protein ThiI